MFAGLQSATGRALQHTEENQHAESGRETAEKTAGRKNRDAGHIEALAAQSGGEPGADGKDDAVGNEIAGENPSGFIGAGAEAPGDVREGDVGNGSIENFHEGGEGDGEGDQPGIVGRTPEHAFGR